MNKKKIKILALIFAVGTGLVFVNTSQAKEKQYNSNFFLFAEVLSIIEKSYVEPDRGGGLINGAIKGMIRTLDPHSAFLNKDELEILRSQTKGHFGGVGLEVSIKDDKLVVIAPISGTPADKKGIKSGDVIVAIMGKPVNLMSMEDAVIIMRGKPGTKVTVTFARKEKEPFDVTFIREEIHVISQKIKPLSDGVAWIKILAFQENMTLEVEKLLKTNYKNEEDLKGAILDLRQNPGGLLYEAVKLADMFLKKGVIVETRQRHEKSAEIYKAKRSGTYSKIPLVVLIDEGSASASEIVAAALQDNLRATVVGMKSFGKGSVQTIFEVGKNYGLKLTTALYYSPSGYSIQAKGVTPDIIIPRLLDSLDEIKDIVEESDLPGHLVTNIKKDKIKIDKINDNQLLTAFQLVKSMIKKNK